MKKLFWLLISTVVAPACQPQASPREQAPARPAVAAVPPPAQRVTASGADSTAALLMLLREVDLTPLVANRPDSSAKARDQVMEGFFGPDHYHISFFFTKARRDSLRPQMVHLWGLNRYKKVVTPFTGTCIVTRLAALPDTVTLEHSQRVNAYTAFASFVLREDPATKGAGVYSGRALFDFTVDEARRVQFANFMEMDAGGGNPTNGGGLVFRGQWQNNKTGQRKPVSWSRFYEAIVPDVLRKLGLGERGDEVHPRLAKYGWSEIWENDEWWAKSPKPSLTL